MAPEGEVDVLRERGQVGRPTCIFYMVFARQAFETGRQRVAHARLAVVAKKLKDALTGAEAPDLRTRDTV